MHTEGASFGALSDDHLSFRCLFAARRRLFLLARLADFRRIARARARTLLNPRIFTCSHFSDNLVSIIMTSQSQRESRFSPSSHKRIVRGESRGENRFPRVSEKLQVPEFCRRTSPEIYNYMILQLSEGIVLTEFSFRTVRETHDVPRSPSVSATAHRACRPPGKVGKRGNAVHMFSIASSPDRQT